MIFGRPVIDDLLYALTGQVMIDYTPSESIRKITKDILNSKAGEERFVTPP